MAIFQSNWALGKHVTPLNGTAGVVHAQRFTYTITSNVGAADIIELGVLPAGCSVVDAVLISDDLGTITLDVGLMSGTVGDPTASRTCGTELFDTAADGSVVRASLDTAWAIAPTNADRSVGVVTSGTVTAASQVVELVLFYRQ